MERASAIPHLHLMQLQHLVEAARASTWTEAARRLHLSQPALSQSLAELERRVGARLFERAGRRRPLTPEGQELLRFAQRTLDEAQELATRLRAGSEHGRLRVGMIDAASLYILPAAIREHRRRHPKLDLQLRVAPSRELLADLRSFELDLTVVVGPVEEQGLVSHPLLDEALHMYSPRGDRSTPQEADWVLYPRGSQTRAQIDQAMAARGVRPRVILESGSPEVLRQMVRLGFGWAVLPTGVATAAGGLQRRGRGAFTTRSLRVVHRESGSGDPRIEEFVELARRQGALRS